MAKIIKNPASIKQVLRIFYDHARPYPFSVAAIIGTAFLGSCYNIVAPLLYKRFFDALAAAKGVPDSATVSQLFFLLSIMAVLLALHWLFWRVNDFFNLHFESRVMRDIMHTSYNYLIDHSYNFFTNSFTGALVKRIGRIARAFEGVSDDIVYKFLPLAVTMGGILVVLFLRNILLGMAFLAWMVLLMIFHVLVARYKHRLDVIKSEMDSLVTATLSDSIANQLTTKLFAGEDYERRLLSDVTGQHAQAQVNSWKVNFMTDAVQGALMGVAEIMMMGAAIYLWQEGLITVGDFALIQAYLITAMSKLWELGEVLRHFYEMFADAAEMVEILETPYEVKDALVPETSTISAGKIEFRGVSFAFNKTQSAFTNFDLIASPKEKIALVGPSGAGKTTLVKLLLRLYDIGHGGIYIDGQNISHIAQKDLRSAIAFVPQESVLFHRSLMENIRYGKRDATDEEVITAAKQAHCHEFISQFPQGYDTFVGERGVKLSGGERQRVAIARAILKNAPILILDEATSSLDSESEHFIQDSLATLMKNKTVIVIAHRLSTIMKMDRIIVLEGGKVADQGTHSELIKKEGLYKKLWDIQVGGFIGE